MPASYQKLDGPPDALRRAGWAVSHDHKAITKTYKFSDFPTAMAFMTAVAFKAEALDHHPEWFNVYNRVDVTLTTHHTDSLSDRDVMLAQAMDEIAGKLAD